jgi:hypothetical protein
MMILTSSTPTLRLKQAEEVDNENLRQWKNLHRQSFFFKDEITPEMQTKWFAKHQSHKWDFMFLAQESTDGGKTFTSTGCMGYRLAENNTIDLYNIMRGTRLEGSNHTMGEAFTLLLCWLHNTYKLPLTCEVLANNPAHVWYEKLGFEVIEERSNPEPHVIYRLNPARLPIMAVALQLG